ncbi:MAG: transketolase family protein, partial [Rickettsiales bacterium]|nr:transketolase family protein [Rickettsiales bacterium]
MFTKKELHLMADGARLLAMDQIQSAGVGHSGIALGFADVITVLFANHLAFDPKHGDWDGRDRFVLSPGHASALLYAVLHLAGYPIPRERLKTFRKMGGLQGHPEADVKLGIEMTTGPLGQGFASAVGLAIACPRRKIYVAVSDGDIMEGVALEAAAIAGIRKLGNLIVLWDDNGITIDGAAQHDDVPAKFRAMGFSTIELDGHDCGEINRAIKIAKKMRGPVLLCCKTVIGRGSKNAGSARTHGMLEYTDLMRVMSDLTPGFEKAAALWKKLADGKSNSGASGAKASRIAIGSPRVKQDKPAATRESFNILIRDLVKRNPDRIIGGSADLSVNSGVATGAANFIHYGVREHAMGAIMNGLALGGFYPYGGTFLVFSNYMSPAIRQAALMSLSVLFVFSHDSIAIGEDGSTHQSIEQLPALRLVPNLNVFRPCNTVEAWLCLRHHFMNNMPSAMVLSKQAFFVPESKDADIHGYYAAGGKRAEVKIVATGSEVALALSVREILEAKKISAAVISAPSLELFDSDII